MNTGSLVQQPILSARAVVKTYRTGTNEVHALCGIDLDVRPGELVMVMGPSGNGKTTLLRRNRESEAAARQEERAHQRDVVREERQAKRHEEELKDWQELIADLRTLLRSDYSQYDDPERTKRAREEWDRNLERRLTALAPFTANIPARKISHRLRVEFHRLRETTFFFQNKDHTDPRCEEQYVRFDVAWNEALFLIGKLIEALGGRAG